MPNMPLQTPFMHSTIKCKLCNQMLTLPSKVLKPPKPKTLISLLTSQTPKTSPNYHTSFSLLSLLQTYKLFNHFTQILSYAFTSGHFTNPYISSQLLNHSLADPNFTLTFSHTLFTQIPDPNVFSCNFLIRAYSHSELPEKSIGLYNQMIKKSMVLDNFTFPFVLKACGRLGSFHKGVEVHCVSLKMGFEFDVFVQNSLIYMYFQCGVVEFAYKVFDFMPESVRDVVTWNSVISGYLQCGCCRKAVYMFGKLLRESDVRLNDVSIVSALTACARIGFLDLGKKIHGLILVYGFVMDVFLGSSLVDMYTKCGCLEDAKKVFDRLLDKNTVCWTSMVAGYLKSDMCKEAIELFREMLVAGVKAEPATIACVVSACGHSGALDLGRWVHNYSERSGIEINVIVKNSLIDMYSKCGLVDKALEVFDSLTNKDIYSWSMIISGLAMNARSKEALQLFSLMEESSEVSPNEVTFLGILSACSHGGFVDEGFYYFEKMTRQYKFSPGVEHYGCLVDLLGRLNLLVEAMGFIGSMPIQPDAVIWRSLLFACSRHGNVELAEVAAKKIKQLEPEKCGAHVLLSNVYASACRWKDVKMVRRNMGAEGIQKQPGCSFIEIDGFVHEFLVADRAHCQIDIICDTLLAMNLVLTSRAPELAFLDFKH